MSTGNKLAEVNSPASSTVFCQAASILFMAAETAKILEDEGPATSSRLDTSRLTVEGPATASLYDIVEGPATASSYLFDGLDTILLFVISGGGGERILCPCFILD